MVETLGMCEDSPNLGRPHHRCCRFLGCIGLNKRDLDVGDAHMASVGTL